MPGTNIRSPICTVVGHVDHGKSSILDRIRGSKIVAGEPGAITQHIGASCVPLEVIRNICGSLLNALKIEFTIPGLLFIDTPGHAAFTNLRKRGGNLADIAILVVDINEGFKPQTCEAIEILKNAKTPFIVAANKVDLVPCWRSQKGNILQIIKQQTEDVQRSLDNKIYGLVGKISEYGFDSERFDRVYSYTKQIAIVPVSAHTGEGMPELLMVLTGLAQKYLEECLKCDVSGPAKGTVLEVKEVKGLGTSMDVILYDGTLKVNDTIVIGGVEQPIVTRVKALFVPEAMAEMRDRKARFNMAKQVVAACGVRITAPDIKDVIGGMPLRGATPETLEDIKEAVQEEIEEVMFETDENGIIIKADTLGSLEALKVLLTEKEIPIRKAGIGNISRRDITHGETNLEHDPLNAVILGFNVESEVSDKTDVKIITGNVVYMLIDELIKWKEALIKKMEEEKLSGVVRPCKFQIMRGYVFRQNNPAVFGVDVEFGTLRAGMPVMKNDGTELAPIKSLQLDQKSVDKAEKGTQVAVSMDHVTVGRQINEGDMLYSSIPEDDFRKLKEFKHLLTKNEVDLIKEIADIKRKRDPLWGAG